MSEIIHITVYGEPMAQKRHRHFSRGKFTQVYDPSSTDKADFSSVAASLIPDQPYDEPLFIVMRSFFSRPKSHFRTGKFAGILKDNAPIYHSNKPDFDNLLKFVADSLGKLYINGEKRSFWRDDSLISGVYHIKKYDHESPRTELSIYPMSKIGINVTLTKK